MCVFQRWRKGVTQDTGQRHKVTNPNEVHTAGHIVGWQ